MNVETLTQRIPIDRETYTLLVEEVGDRDETFSQVIKRLVKEAREARK
jgi:predicted CopG family antitoxin